MRVDIKYVAVYKFNPPLCKCLLVKFHCCIQSITCKLNARTKSTFFQKSFQYACFCTADLKHSVPLLTRCMLPYERQNMIFRYPVLNIEITVFITVEFVHYLPWKTGLRFSMKAFVPSSKSSVDAISPNVFASNA